MSWIRETEEEERLKAFLELIADGFDDPVQLARDALAGNIPPVRGAIINASSGDQAIYIATVE